MGSGLGASLVEGGPERGAPATLLMGLLASGLVDSGGFVFEAVLGLGAVAVDFLPSGVVAQEASVKSRAQEQSRAGQECMVKLTKAKEGATGKSGMVECGPLPHWNCPFATRIESGRGLPHSIRASPYWMGGS